MQENLAASGVHFCDQRPDRDEGEGAACGLWRCGLE